jgi:hypothetical protein
MENNNFDSNEFTLLKGAYERISALNKDDQNRLYQFAGAYIAVAMPVVIWLFRDNKTFSEVNPIFWALAGLVSTFYVIFYSYVSSHLLDTVSYLQIVWSRLNKLHNGVAIPSWEAFYPPGEGKAREIINYVLSFWRVVTLILTIIFPIIGFTSGKGYELLNLISLLFALFIGLPITVLSIVYAIKVHKQLRPIKKST